MSAVRIAAFTLLIAWLGCAAPVLAQGVTWDGGGADDLWSTAANWKADVAPRPGDIVRFQGAVRTAPINDLLGTPLSGVLFDFDAAAFTLQGNRLSIFGGGIANQSIFVQTISNEVAFSGNVRINEVFFPALARPITFNGVVTVQGGTVTTAGISVVTFNGPLAGGSGLFGAPVLDVASGFVILGSAQNSYAGAARVSAGGVLRLEGHERIPNHSTIEMAGGVLDLNGATETVAGLGSVGSAQNSGVILGNGGHLIVDSGLNQQFIGTIEGSGQLTKTGSGNLGLSTVFGAASSYTGGTRVLGGTLTVGGGSLPDAGPVTVEQNGILAVQGSEGIGVLHLNGGLVIGGGSLAASSYELRSGTAGVALRGSGGLNKTTTGTVELTAANDYEGATNVAAGLLRIRNAFALPHATDLAIAGGATLELEHPVVGQTTTVGSLTGDGTLLLKSGTLAIGADSESSTFSGTFSGPASFGGGLRKVGAGTLTLSGPHHQAGFVSVEEGALDLPNGLAGAGDTLSVAAGARLSARGLVNRRILLVGDLAASGDLILGNLADGHVGGNGLLGTLDVGSHLVQLVNTAGPLNIAGRVLLGEGGRLTVLDQDQGFGLAGGAFGTATITASGNASIAGNLTNNGVVNGPTGPGETLTLTDDVTGVGSYTGNVTFADGFSPGLSPAVISMENATFDGTSSLLMELAASAHDKLELTGRLKLEGGLLTIALLDGFAPQAGQVFDLFDFSSIEGTFGNVLLPTLAEGLYWQTDSLYLDGSIAVAVPEPQTYALLLAGLGLLGFAARRRRK